MHTREREKTRYFRPEQIKDQTLELPSTCNGIFFSGKNMSSSRLYLIPGSLINQTLSRPLVIKDRSDVTERWSILEDVWSEIN